MREIIGIIIAVIIAICASLAIFRIITTAPTYIHPKRRRK